MRVAVYNRVLAATMLQVLFCSLTSQEYPIKKAMFVYTQVPALLAFANAALALPAEVLIVRVMHEMAGSKLAPAWMDGIVPHRIVLHSSAFLDADGKQISLQPQTGKQLALFLDRFLRAQ